MPIAWVTVNSDLEPVLRENFPVIDSSPWDEDTVIVQLEHDRGGTYNLVLGNGKPTLKLDEDV